MHDTGMELRVRTDGIWDFPWFKSLTPQSWKTRIRIFFGCRSGTHSVSLVFAVLSCFIYEMTRKKGDLNMTTRRKIEEEKSRSSKKAKIFQFHKTVVIKDAIVDPAIELVSSVDGANPTHSNEQTVEQIMKDHIEVVDSGNPMQSCHMEKDKGKSIMQDSMAVNTPDIGANRANQEKSRNDNLETSNQWIKELVQLKYNESNIDSPSLAVQTILACIKSKEIHNLICSKEVNLPDKNKSLVTFLGFNGWFRLCQRIKLSKKLATCKECIDLEYAESNSLFFKRTVLADNVAKVFMEGLTALEAANEISSSFQNEEPETSKLEVSNDLNCCLFSDQDLADDNDFEEENQLKVSTKENEKKESENEAYENVPNLNLVNSACFPVITEQLVECYSPVYEHAIWTSQNFGALAPIDIDTWTALVGISKEEVANAKRAAHKLEKYFNKLESGIPFTLEFLKLSCIRNSGIQILQKGHMAYPSVIRDDFYLKRLWRTHCPYFTCKCEKNVKFLKRNEEKCNSGIVWFDQAIWFLLNNLEQIFPGSSPLQKMIDITKFLNNSVRPAILAYISYLEVRKVLLEMTSSFAKTPDRNLKVQFGGDNLADVAEKMIKPISFLKAQIFGNRNSSSKPFYGNKNVALTVNRVLPKMPPRICVDPRKTTSAPAHQSTPIVVSNAMSCNNPEDYSITKGANKYVDGSAEVPMSIEE